MDVRKLVISTALALAAVTAVFAGIGVVIRDPLIEFSKGFVALLGGPGIALGYFVPDAFTVPIPNDAFGMIGLAAGVGFVPVLAWGSAGSIAGGCMGWVIGRSVGRTAWFRRFMKRRARGIEPMIERHGVSALAVAALTPIPYSLACWAAGATQMGFGVFFAVSLLRIVRVGVFLALIHLGLASL